MKRILGWAWLYLVMVGIVALFVFLLVEGWPQSGVLLIIMAVMGITISALNAVGLK